MKEWPRQDLNPGLCGDKAQPLPTILPDWTPPSPAQKGERDPPHPVRKHRQSPWLCTWGDDGTRVQPMVPCTPHMWTEGLVNPLDYQTSKEVK